MHEFMKRFSLDVSNNIMYGLNVIHEQPLGAWESLLAVCYTYVGPSALMMHARTYMLNLRANEYWIHKFGHKIDADNVSRLVCMTKYMHIHIYIHRGKNACIHHTRGSKFTLKPV
jgi:hypothetical protein